MGIVNFNKVAGYTLDVDAALVSQDPSKKTSTIYWRIIVNKNSSPAYYSPKKSANSGWADSNMGGNPDLWSAPSLSFDFRNTYSILFAEGTFLVPHRADGNAEYQVTSGLLLEYLGYAQASTGIRQLPRIGGQPQAPVPLPFGEITSNSIQYRFAGGWDGGSKVLEWQVHYGRDPYGGELAASSNGGTPMVDLLPGTTYYFWSRARNYYGWGPFSKRSSATTLPGGAWVRVNGVWKQAIPYVKVNGVWKQAIPYVKVNGVWRQTT